MAGKIIDSRFDQHGFLIDGLEKEERCHGCCSEVLRENSFADTDMLRVIQEENDENESLTKFLDYIKQGLTRSERGQLWSRLLQAESTKEKAKETFKYQDAVIELSTQLKTYGWTVENGLSALVKIIDCRLTCQDDISAHKIEYLKLMRQVLMDVDRTFPNHEMFITGSQNQYYLFRILVLYSQYNSVIGYCQGMAYVAGLLLMYIQEEETIFWSLVSLLENQCYMFYDNSLKRVKVLAELLKLLIREKHPQLDSHLTTLGVHPLMYTTQWFMALFTGLKCWDTVLLIADLFFHGGLHHLINSAVVIMEICKMELLSMSRLDQVLPFLQNIPNRLIHRIHVQKSLLDNPTFGCLIELEDYLEIAEENVGKEEREMEDVRKGYLLRNHRKRSYDTTDSLPNPANHGLLTRLASVFTPAKKCRMDDTTSQLVNSENTSIQNDITKTKPPDLSKSVSKNRSLVTSIDGSIEIRTPVNRSYSKTNNVQTKRKQNLSTSSIHKSVLNSVKKGQAELRYTKESGLIYTSPNTIEMTELITTTLPHALSKSLYDKENICSEAVKLTFESPYNEKSFQTSPLVRQIETFSPRRSPRIAKRRIEGRSQSFL